MQLDIAEFPVQILVHIVSDLLESIIQTNDELMINTPLTRFHSRAKPSITIHAYLTRILKFAPFSNEALLSLLVYFDRIASKKQYAVNSLNVHRLLITSVVVASKFTSDVYYPNSRYAKVGGLPLLELNQLELEFLFLCDFQLHVPLEDLQDYGNQLLYHAVSKSSPALVSTHLSLPPSPIEQQQQQQNQKQSVVVAVPRTPPTPVTITAPISLTTTKSKKRPYQQQHQQVTSVRKRFCPSPPYNTNDTRATKTKTAINTTLSH
ncbi:cyclin-domain-containing protein [Halteromyces radiatus]|uniref:cyclin-domain-containing protein n=1 Tax=Halteromyces radiatus TaxID=101107 RepID=UPI00221FB1F2|nr:cyclin-domain-containing protein [Halteromyces radiatus]KAI8099602.1 cyclin-domain-containing protein [Halteromyces radiatus]